MLLLASGSFSSYAEDTPPPDAGLLMRENRTSPLPPQPQPKPELETPIQAKPQMLPQNNLRVTVKKFVFTGNTQFTNTQLESLLNSYTEHEIGFKELQDATNLITQHYHSNGFFLAMAYLPQQALKEGQLEIAILEGQLDNAHLSGSTVQAQNEVRLNKTVLQRFLDTHAEGEVISEEDLNRLSLLINDLPGIESKVVLAPGSKTGTSSLGLKVREDSLLKGYLATDNYGLYSTGYYRFDVGVTLNDPTGYGDQLNLRAQTTETGGTVSGWADYSIPINGYGTRLAVNFSELHYSLGRSFKDLEAHGIARTVGTSLMHPLWLSKNGRLTGIAHYEHRWMQDKVDAFLSDNDRELNVMSFSFSGNLYDQLFDLSGITQAYINVSAGEVSFNNQTAYNLDQQTGAIKSNGGYHKFNWQLSRIQNIVEDFSVFTNFQGQVASKNLDTSEQISLGGPNAIRAYPVGEGSADEGWMFNAEARYHLPISQVPGYLQFVGFIDTGFSRVNANPLPGDLNNSRHLTGYGFGINWLNVEGFNLRTSIAWRDINKQPTSDPTADGPMMYFQLSKSL
jgi:hemolysin activation/secretion protein